MYGKCRKRSVVRTFRPLSFFHTTPTSLFVETDTVPCFSQFEKILCFGMSLLRRESSVPHFPIPSLQTKKQFDISREDNKLFWSSRFLFRALYITLSSLLRRNNFFIGVTTSKDLLSPSSHTFTRSRSLLQCLEV